MSTAGSKVEGLVLDHGSRHPDMKRRAENCYILTCNVSLEYGKRLVGGVGDIKLTKDGNTLLKEMQIQNPPAIMIARTAVAQDDISGDGTTSTVLFIGELMKQSECYVDEGINPRVLVDGFEIAKSATLTFLENFMTPVVISDVPDKEILRMLARTTLRTKLYEALADQLTDIVADAVLCICKPEEAIDLFMLEIMQICHKFNVDTRLVEDLVLDHGSRHPDVKRRAENCYILTCIVSLEYEKRLLAYMYSMWHSQSSTRNCISSPGVGHRERKMSNMS